MKNNIKIINEAITYPKSKTLIIPANTKGWMTRGVSLRVVEDGKQIVAKEARQVALEGNLEVGDCFYTGSGRLKRRGAQRIYHAVIKRLPSDYTSVDIVGKALEHTLKAVIDDGWESVAICGLGIHEGDLDKEIVASLTVRICKKYFRKILIKIVDSDKEFIDNIQKYMET